jgi:L-ascorbate metabolism protein UlaG (beta-lactamase superfamily)
MYNQLRGGLMEITWYGYSCFRLAERGMATVVTDPYDHREVGLEPLKLKADIVTVSKDEEGHNYTAGVKGDVYRIPGPGEYEIGGVFITGVQTNASSKRGAPNGMNTLFVIDYNGLTVAHLGNLQRVPNQAEVEALGPVNIALVPVGGGDSLNAAKAAEVISMLEPNLVIPMQYSIAGVKKNLDPISKFLKEMGLAEVASIPTLKVTSANSLPEETRVTVLDYPHN